MNANHTELNPLSEKVLAAVFEVSNTLGAGFLEKVYQRALVRELGLRGIRCTAEASFAITRISAKYSPTKWPLYGPVPLGHPTICVVPKNRWSSYGDTDVFVWRSKRLRRVLILRL